MARPKTVYRGRRRYYWVITLVMFLAALAFLAAVGLFYHLQKYIEYDKDTLDLTLPFMRTEDEGTPSGEEEVITVAPPVDAEVVVDPTDFSAVTTTAGAELQSIKGYYIYGDYVDAASIAYYASRTMSESRGAVVLQLKKTDGQLCYLSGVPNVSSYGVNGVQMIDDAVAEAKALGVYMVAEISSLLDTAMAERNAPISLKQSATGFPAKNEAGAWLDPYNEGTREYIGALIAELALIGFDEVILSNLVFPEIEGIAYSQPMFSTPDRASAVSSFAVAMRSVAEAAGIRLSVRCDEASLRLGSSSYVGQDLSLFFRVFDRVYFETGAETLSSDAASLAGFLGSTDQNRIVPMTGPDAPEWGSFVIK